MSATQLFFDSAHLYLLLCLTLTLVLVLVLVLLPYDCLNTTIR